MITIYFLFLFYRIKNTSPASYTKNDIFDCWLYQNKSWSDLVSISENKNDNHKIISSSTNLISKAKRYVLKHIDTHTYKVNSVISTKQFCISSNPALFYLFIFCYNHKILFTLIDMHLILLIFKRYQAREIITF